jgi:hypothetical protein
MALWKPSLLMSVFNVRLTSDVVKPKANIYNDLRTFTGSAASQGLNCIAGDQDGQETPGQVTMSVMDLSIVGLWLL